jgi:calcineurin-like phosphoesterase family protein
LTKIVFFGDPDVTSDADDIYTAGLKEQNVDLYVNLGDNGYHGANPVELLEKYFPKDSEQYKKLVLVLGNHDDGESESDSTEQKCGAYLPEQYKSKPEFEGTDQSWQDTRWLTTKQIGDIFFFTMNSQDMDVEFKRNQYNWIEQQINTAKNLRQQKKIKWIIGGVHKPWFTLKSSHSPYTAVREIYSKMFEDVVNQMWHGHNHNDQSWWSMIAINQSGNAAGVQKQVLLADGKTIDHSQPHGWTTNINGHSGHEHNAFKENATANKNVIWANDKTFSYAVVESNGDILNTKWKDKSGTVLHEYNISDTGSTTPPPDCSEPNKCKDPVTGECRPLGVGEHKSPTDGTCQKNPDPDCPPGQHKDANGNCVPDVHTCPQGQHWDEIQQKCVPDVIPGEIICPRDYHYDQSLQKCIPDLEPDIPPVCPVGTTWNGKICVRDNVPPCLQGECKDPVTGQCRLPGINEKIGANGFCEPIQPTGCPDGQCKDLTTGQCRPIGANEEKDANGFCKTKPQPGEEIDAEAEALIIAKVGETIVLKDKGSKGPITRHEWLKETADAQAITLIPDSSVRFGAKFVATDAMVNKDIKFRLRVFDANNKSNDDVTGTKVTINSAPQPGGNSLYDSNTDGKWNNGQKRTVTEGDGNQEPDGKGLHTAASGNPTLTIDGDGIAHLESSRWGRIYIYAKNYNFKLEGFFMFETDHGEADNISIKLRSRHGNNNHPQGGSNQFGGIGFAFHPSGEVEIAAEITHGGSSFDFGNLQGPKLGLNEWHKYTISGFDEGGGITAKVAIDDKDIGSKKWSNPHATAIDKAAFAADSYFWIRLNCHDGKRAKAAIKNLVLTDIT